MSSFFDSLLQGKFAIFPTSYTFFVFLAAVALLFFALPHRHRWLFLLIVSYGYYMLWGPQYIALILTTTFIVYGTALMMAGRSKRMRQVLVAASVVSNLGILFVFKYYNFFNTSLKDLFNLLGLSYQVPALNLVLPVGISFYTFQALSYTIDVYRGTREPERHLGIFALYVSFFPVILSGPIERSTTLLPQLYREVSFDYQRVTDGLKLIAWGLFQKMVIADRLSLYVSMVYENPHAVTGLPLLMATYMFAFQILCDFSGYTDVAIGTAQILGYRLMPNFRRPFLAQTLAELWRRWHISLISWFRDYLYISLGGNRVLKWRNYLNILIVFSLSGLWHGAEWTFVIWGALNGVFLIIGRVTQRLRDWIREGLFAKAARVSASAFFILAAAGASAAAGFLMSKGLKGIGPAAAAGFAGAIFIILGAVRASGMERYARFLDSFKRFLMIFFTFHLLTIGAVFFRSKNLADAWYVFTHWASFNILAVPLGFNALKFSLMVLCMVILVTIHWIQEKRGSIRELIRVRPWWYRWGLYLLLCWSIVMLGYRGAGQFIYFRF